MLIFLTLLGKYSLEKEGATECQSGSKVVDKSHCVSACKDLNIAMGTVPLQDGKPCFRGIHAASGNYQCRQAANLGVKANLICQTSGDQQYCPFSVIIPNIQKTCNTCCLYKHYIYFQGNPKIPTIGKLRKIVAHTPIIRRFLQPP